jgi:hypothetical protein
MALFHLSEVKTQKQRVIAAANWGGYYKNNMVLASVDYKPPSGLVSLGSPRRNNSAAEDGAGEGDRTLVLSLENSCSTIELHPHCSSALLLPKSLLLFGATLRLIP